MKPKGMSISMRTMAGAIGGIAIAAWLLGLIYLPDLLRVAAVLIALAWVLGMKVPQARGLLNRIWKGRAIQSAGTGVYPYLFLGVLTLYAVVLGVSQALALQYPLFDVGIFHQIIWNVAQGFRFVSTISGAGNLFDDHFSPALAVLAPFFHLADGSPLLLPILQPILIYGGLAAWIWWIGRCPVPDSESADEFGSLRAQMRIGIVIWAALFGSLWRNLQWGFHENSLAFPALCWFLALATDPLMPKWASSGRSWIRRWILILVLALIAACSKEQLLLTVGGFLVFLGMSSLSRSSIARIKSGVAIAVGLGLVLTFYLFITADKAEDKNYFERYYSYWGSSFGEVFLNIFRDPLAPFRVVGLGEMLSFIVQLLLPFAALPLVFVRRLFGAQEGHKDPIKNEVSKTWPTFSRFFRVGLVFLAALPIGLALFATYDPLRGMGFHYVLEIWPALILMSLIVIVQLPRQQRNRALAIVLLGTVFTLERDPWKDFKTYWKDATTLSQVRQAMLAVPPGATVMASENAGPWIARRLVASRYPSVGQFPGPAPHGCPQWVILDRGDLKNFVQSSTQQGSSQSLDATTSKCPATLYRQEWQHQGWTGLSLN